jgi:peroxiredoxin
MKAVFALAIATLLSFASAFVATPTFKMSAVAAPPKSKGSVIAPGDKFPTGTTVRIQGADGPEPKDPAELFANKKVVLFGVPGAFTPTCSSQHLPGYASKTDELKQKGVDVIACTAVNDMFVMKAWAKDQGIGDNVLMLADGNGELAAALGVLSDKTGSGMGNRNQRFAMIIDNGVVKSIDIDEKGMEKTGADAILQKL